MSIHSERQNLLKNKSGNAPLVVSSRSGDKEEGKELFDFMPSRLTQPFETLLEDEEKAARVDFLRRYFKLLKNILNPFEYFAVKEMFTSGRELREVCSENGLSFIQLSPRIKAKITQASEQITELVECSDWDRSEMFTRVFLRSAPEIVSDGKLLKEMQDEPLNIGNISAKLSEAERIKRERDIRAAGYRSGKAVTKAQVRDYLSEIVSLAEFKPYINQFVSREFNDKLKNIRQFFEAMFRPEIFKIALNCTVSEELDYTPFLNWFETLSKHIVKRLDELESEQVFKSVIMSDDIAEIFENDTIN